MRILYSIIFSVLLCVSASLNAQWVSFDKSTNSPKEPTVKLISSDSKSTVLEVEISGVMIKQLETPDGTFQQVNFLSDVYTTEVGKPAVPHIAKILAIPDDASVSYHVLEVGDVETIKDILLPPARESWYEGEPESEYILDDKSYTSESVFPGEYASIGDPMILRDFRISRVGVYPAQYNAQKRELNVVKKLIVEVRYGNDQTVNKKTSPQRDIAPSFASIYRSTIFNYKEVLDAKYNGKEDGEEVLLLICPDNFLPHFTDYIEWKKKAGFNVIATSFTEIGATSTNPVTIYDYIKDMYYSETPPTYVVTAGDAQNFPYKIAVYSDYSFPDEDYFVKIDGVDFIPDMFIGRISVQTENTLDVILHKTILYEKSPYVEETNWFTKGICCSNNAYESQVLTKEFTADVMREDGNFTLVNEYMSDGWGSDCTYSVSDVLEALNEGRSFLNYRGEGWSTGWWASCTPFQIEDLSNLQNGEKFTFVTSIGCGVGMFNSTGGNCFGEQWLKMGTIENPRGAVNFIGPTSNTHTTYNNYLDKGIYIGIFQEGLYTPGQALLRGKMHVLEEFGTSDYNTEYQFRVFCNLGDPTTKLWKTIPVNISASYPDSIPLNNNSLSVSCYSGNSSFVSDANVNISGENFSINAKTNSAGVAIFDFTPTQPETVNITITGQGIFPFLGTMEIVDESSISDMNNMDSKSLQNIPNPFTVSTEISFKITQPSNVTLNIYNVQGQVVRTLIDEYKATGVYAVIWDGKDNSGQNMNSGVYLYSVKTSSGINTGRMLKIE